MAETQRWTVVVAEQEPNHAPDVRRAWPCTHPTTNNRYLGCIGVRRCKARGIQTCVFGRWPAKGRTEWADFD